MKNNKIKSKNRSKKALEIDKNLLTKLKSSNSKK